jgi:PAS domain S-box-containing protein
MAVDQIQAEVELRRALHDGQVVPYFQPLVQVRSGAVCGFEVLARWLHPVRGVVNPDEFIAVAERFGMIDTLTETILLRAFQAAALHKDVQLAINISPLQLRDRSLPERIHRVAKQGRYPLHRLTIEITESSLVDNLELAAHIANDLKQLGVKLALDDFGTGYSSLSNLQALPFDEIKVDRTFVGSMIDNRDSRKIVAAVVGLGQSLGLTTVAEGIENRAQAEMLQWLGCDVGQGWLYGPPVPASEIANMLATPMHITGTVSDGTRNPVPSGFLDMLPVVHRAESRAIYDGAPVGLCFLDRDLRYVSVNERLIEMHGVPISQRLGRRFGEVFPDLASHLEPYLHRALNGEPVCSLELRRPNPNLPGEFSTLLFSCHPARDEAGEIMGLSIAVVDITDRTRIEGALQDLGERYRQIFELKPCMLWAIGRGGIAVETHPDCGPVTVMSPEQICKNEWLAAWHLEDRSRAILAISHSLQTGEPVDIEHRMRGDSGAWRWFRSRGKAQRGPAGEVVGWYGTSEDIDDYKKLSDSLQECEERLRTFELQGNGGLTIQEPERG